MHPRRHLPASIAILSASLSVPAAAQEPPTLGPGHPDLRIERLAPFDAEYEQMGARFRTRLVRAGPHWSFQMVVESDQGAGIDHVGHHADDLAFAYRRFRFGAFGSEYIDASQQEGSLHVIRVPLDSADAPTRRHTVALDRPVFDGTFAYWLLGVLPLQLDYEVRLHTWRLTEDGAGEHDTPPFRVIGRESVIDDDGHSYDSWIVSVRSGPQEFRSWVVTEPPYLVKQEMRVEGEEAVTVVRLRGRWE